MYSYRLKKEWAGKLDPDLYYRVAKDGTECAYLWILHHQPNGDVLETIRTKIGWIPASEKYDWNRACTVRYDPGTNKLYHDDAEGYKESRALNDLNTLLYEKSTEPPTGNYPTVYPPKKETMLENLIATNKAAATQAAYLEAGRLANVTMAEILFKKFPSLPQTPFNALVIANLADVIGKQIKPSPKLQKVTGAMVTQAYAEVYQLIDLEGMIGELLNTVGDSFAESE